jgi:ornithine carbamoyltransferase
MRLIVKSRPSRITPLPVVVVADSMKGRSFTQVADWDNDELLEVLDLAAELKRLQQAREEQHLLPGRTLGMILQKPSTRTRVSFEVGIYQLGGAALYLSAGDLQLGRGETIKDTATCSRATSTRS